MKTLRLHASKKPIKRLISRRIGNWARQLHSIGKPHGLRYGLDDSWLRWCSTEMRVWLDSYRVFYGLDLSGANILKLCGEADILEFHEGFKGKASKPVPGFPREYGDHEIDWTRVWKEWDGIEIAPYQWSLRFNLHWYYSWDVASGCVWRTKGVKIRKIPDTRKLIAQYYRGKP